MRNALVLPAAVIATGLALLGLEAARVARAHGVRGEAVGEPARSEAARAVEVFLQLSAHLHGSGGDDRFADAIPASPLVVNELVAAASFALHRGEIEEPRLVRSELRNPTWAGRTVLTLDSTEYWVVRVRDAKGTELRTRAEVVEARYHLLHSRREWTVVGWDLLDGSRGEAAR